MILLNKFIPLPRLCYIDDILHNYVQYIFKSFKIRIDFGNINKFSLLYKKYLIYESSHSVKYWKNKVRFDIIDDLKCSRIKTWFTIETYHAWLYTHIEPRPYTSDRKVFINGYKKYYEEGLHRTL